MGASLLAVAKSIYYIVQEEVNDGGAERFIQKPHGGA